MQIIETYGKYIEKWANTNPDRARVLLKLGWEAQNLKYKFTPDKRLLPADRYLAHLMMNTMLMPLKNPQECAIVSIFTPCEILHEAGLHPYNVEAFSCYLSASNAERAFYSRQRTQEFQKHYAAIIRHFGSGTEEDPSKAQMYRIHKPYLRCKFTNIQNISKTI